MSDDKVHPWVYVIIPINTGSKERALFTAFCKDCRNYFSEFIPFDGSARSFRFTKSSLPKYGCKPDDEFRPGVGFSTLPGV